MIKYINTQKNKTSFVVMMLMLFLPLSAQSTGQGLIESSGIKPLLIQAIDAPGGRMSAVLTGDIANFFKGVTRSSHPVIANVTTVGSFNQPGCKRLNLHLQQQLDETVSGESQGFDVAYGINLCRDGDAPDRGSILIAEK